MIISFVPLRGGSKSIPLKNIKTFCGKPLAFWVLSELQISTKVDKIVVATDSVEIAETVISFNFSKVEIYYRDEINARDISTTEDVILEYINKHTFNVEDYLLLVQATSPFTRANDFDQAINNLKFSDSTSLLSCSRFSRFIWNKNSEPINYDYKNRPRRQDCEEQFIENGAFYLSSITNIINTRNRISGKILIYEMPEYCSVEIDEELDWVIAEKIMYKYVLKENKKQLEHIKLFLSDIDGTLTDSGMYYSDEGVESKKFNTRDGKGFELLRDNNIKTGLITTEVSNIVDFRSKKLKIDYVFQGVANMSKLEKALEICKIEKISINEVAYIGDDLNCLELLSAVGLAACPNDAVLEIKQIENILVMNSNGGNGCVREFIEYILR